MYDNIDMTLGKEHYLHGSFINDIPQHLTAVSSQGESEYGVYIIGYLDDLKVKISERNIKLYGNSLCKYYLGNNFKTLSKGDSRRAIEKISDSIHLPIQEANVTRIDVAQNFIMKHDEKLYYPYLGESNHYNRLEQNNGLYYNTRKRRLVFYGKVQEQQAKNKPIPLLYKDKPVLRYELRFVQRLREQLKVPHLSAKLLYDEKFYLGLIKRWKDEYLSIQKINNIGTNLNPTGSKKELQEQLASLSIKQVGQPQLLNQIKEWQSLGYITNKQAYELRAMTKTLSQIQIAGQQNDLILELDKKVKEAARFA